MREEIRLGNEALARNDMETARQYFQQVLETEGTPLQKRIAVRDVISDLARAIAQRHRDQLSQVWACQSQGQLSSILTEIRTSNAFEKDPESRLTKLFRDMTKFNHLI